MLLDYVSLIPGFAAALMGLVLMAEKIPRWKRVSIVLTKSLWEPLERLSGGRRTRNDKSRHNDRQRVSGSEIQQQRGHSNFILLHDAARQI